jgi:hypothetical protein
LAVADAPAAAKPPVVVAAPSGLLAGPADTKSDSIAIFGGGEIHLRNQQPIHAPRKYATSSSTAACQKNAETPDIKSTSPNRVSLRRVRRPGHHSMKHQIRSVLDRPTGKPANGKANGKSCADIPDQFQKDIIHRHLPNGAVRV